jgi:hypothetical protein
MSTLFRAAQARISPPAARACSAVYGQVQE